MHESNLVAKHINVCDSCKKLLQDEFSFASKIKCETVIEPDIAVWQTISDAILQEKISLPRKISDAFYRNLRPVAAMFSFVLLLGTIYFGYMNPKSISIDEPAYNSNKIVAWSDDPMGQQTDNLISTLDNM